MLDHPCGVAISRRLLARDLDGIGGVNVRNMSMGYCWYDLPTTDIDGKRVSISLCFNEGSIHLLQLALADPKIYGAGWNDWSEAKERRRANDTKNWLKAMGYSTGRFAWGEIWAGFDPKGGSGCAAIRYDTEQVEAFTV